jgi:hypothetical protein
MMKYRWKILALCSTLALATLGACGGGTTSDGGVVDMSVSGASCAGIVTCILGSTDSATDIMSCVATGSATATTKYMALLTCSYDACTTSFDGGAPACTSATDSSTGCLSCATAAGAGAVCMTERTTCLADQ